MKRTKGGVYATSKEWTVRKGIMQVKNCTLPPPITFLMVCPLTDCYSFTRYIL